LAVTKLWDRSSNLPDRGEGCQTLLDPSNLHVGAGVGTACQQGCAGDPNQIGSGSTLDIFQVSNNDTAAVNAPVLLILSVPDDPVDMTKTFFGATAGGVYTSLGVQFYNGGAPLTGTANVAGTGFFTNLSKTNPLGLQANSGPLSGAFYGSLGAGQEVYSFLNFTEGGINNSNSFANFTLPGNDSKAISFGVYVIALNGGVIGGNGLINVTGLNLPTGTFVDALGEDSKGRPFVVPFTEAGLTDGPSPAPEPASMLLYGTGLFLIGGILRRRSARSVSAIS
jgi:hypothetical protein